MVVTDRPFIPPSDQPAPGSSSQQPSGQKKGKKATQPAQAPGALPSSQQMEVSGEVSATQPVEAPGADTENSSTDQDSSRPTSTVRTGSRPDPHLPVSAKHNVTSGSRSSQTGKVSVKVPVDKWLCKKFEKLNITLQEGYPTRNSETVGLSKDQFI